MKDCWLLGAIAARGAWGRVEVFVSRGGQLEGEGYWWVNGCWEEPTGCAFWVGVVDVGGLEWCEWGFFTGDGSDFSLNGMGTDMLLLLWLRR